jgi:beta-glucosidase
MRYDRARAAWTGTPAAHHQLLGHGLATVALRAAGVPQVMITNNYSPARPASGNNADRAG